MTCRRVVITGLGIVSPHGTSASSVFSALLEGRSAVRSIEVASDAGTIQFVGAQTIDEPWTAQFSRHVPTSDKVGLFALTAADAAIRDAKLDLECENLSRIGVAVGTSLGGVIT